MGELHAPAAFSPVKTLIFIEWEAGWAQRRSGRLGEEKNHLSLSFYKVVSHLLCRGTVKTMTVSQRNWFHGSDTNSEPPEDEISV